jgi:hypothetical protein
VFREGQEIGASTAAPISIPAGTHTLTLVNERFEFERVEEVTVVARRRATLTLAAPTGTLHLNATPWARVWIDGRRAGDTPLGNLVLPIGEHEVVLRHPELGELRRIITVGARTPVHVGVEFPQ